jgi:hypothetical protein
MKKKVKVIFTVEIDETPENTPTVKGVLEDGSIISFSRESILRSVDIKPKEDSLSDPRVSC